MKQCLVLLVALQQGFSLFYIKKVEPSLVVVSPGEAVSLYCEANDHYEYCKFISPQQKICDFEWKRSEGNITMQECDQTLLDKKVSFHGKYDDKQCGMTFVVGPEDEGTWTCEIEEYLLGRDRHDGRKDNGTMHIKIDKSSSVSTSTTTITTTITSSSSTSADTSSTTAPANTTLSSTPTTEDSSKVPDAVPRTDDIENVDTGSGNTSTVVAIIVIIIIVSCVGASAYYYRRRQRKRPDAAAAVVYDREFRQNHDTTNMMQRSGSQTGVNTCQGDLSIRDLHTDDPDNRQHLHEFFPHSDSFA